jgi:hypothetical protein
VDKIAISSYLVIVMDRWTTDNAASRVRDSCGDKARRTTKSAPLSTAWWATTR